MRRGAVTPPLGPSGGSRVRPPAGPMPPMLGGGRQAIGILQDMTTETVEQADNDIKVISCNWFVNRCPIVTRTPRNPVGSTTFSMVGREPRARVAMLAKDVAATDSQLTLTNAGPFMNGDVLELPTEERVEIVCDPDLATNVVPVRRRVEGTTAGCSVAGEILRLIGNSRSGDEVHQRSIPPRAEGVTQFCQTWQHPVQVGGALQASTDYPTRDGIRSPFEQAKMDALQNLMDDMESSTYYGRGEDPAIATRPKQKGLRTLLQANRTTEPVNADRYTTADFLRDTLEVARAGGGDPDVLLLSSSFMVALGFWGQAAMRLEAGLTIFGVKIDVYEVPFLGGVSVIEAPLLRTSTAVALTSSEIRMRMKRNEFWSPRGSRGDAFEGDWIAEGAVELDNPRHHSWLEGVKRFAP